MFSLRSIILFIVCSLSITTAHSQQIDSVKIVHNMLKGTWMDKNDSELYMLFTKNKIFVKYMGITSGLLINYSKKIKTTYTLYSSKYFTAYHGSPRKKDTDYIADINFINDTTLKICRVYRTSRAFFYDTPDSTGYDIDSTSAIYTKVPASHSLMRDIKVWP